MGETTRNGGMNEGTRNRGIGEGTRNPAAEANCAAEKTAIIITLTIGGEILAISRRFAYPIYKQALTSSTRESGRYHVFSVRLQPAEPTIASCPFHGLNSSTSSVKVANVCIKSTDGQASALWSRPTCRTAAAFSVLSSIFPTAWRRDCARW